MNYWVYALFYMFLTFIVGQLFIQENLKLIFFLVMFLLYVSLNNIYFSTKYYIKLRNTPGIKGERGDPGDPGQDGSDGVCTIAKDCGIANCRLLIQDKLKEKFPSYQNILDKIKTNVSLNNKDKKIYQLMNDYLDKLVPECENYQGGEDVSKRVDNFKEHIDKIII